MRNHKNEYRLNSASKNGVNFGGHYILASWYIPDDDADQDALIDVRDGKIFFPPELKPNKVPADDNAQYIYCEVPENNEPMYKPDSLLYVIEGLKPSDEYKKDAHCGIYYLEWTGTDFKQIKFVEKPEWTRHQPQ